MIVDLTFFMKTRPAQFSAKKLFTWSHRWLGIVIGLYFIFLGLSGSWLVYKETFDSWIKPSLRVAETAVTAPGLLATVEGAQAGVNTDRWPVRIVVPEDPRLNPVVSFNLSQPDGPRIFRDTHVDRSTHVFKGAEEYRSTLTGWLYIWHHELWGGPWGHGLTAVGGMLCLILLIAGLWISVPQKGDWKKIFVYVRPRGNLHWFREIHRVTGVYGFTLMLLITVSGTYLARPMWFGPSPTRSPRAKMGDFGDPKSLVAGLKALSLQMATHEIPIEGTEMRFNPTTKQVDLTSSILKKKFRFDFQTQKLSDADSAGAEVAATRVDVFHQTQHEIHVGDYFGWLGRALTFIAGFLPLFFYITGFYYWFKRRS